MSLNSNINIKNATQLVLLKAGAEYDVSHAVMPVLFISQKQRCSNAAMMVSLQHATFLQHVTSPSFSVSAGTEYDAVMADLTLAFIKKHCSCDR